MDIFTLQKRIQADKEVRKIIESGEVPVVDLSIFDCLDNLIISDENKKNAEKTIQEYKDLLGMLKALPPVLRNKFLEVSQNDYIVQNQVLEDEDSFLISLYREIDCTSALEKTIDHYGRPFDRKTFIENHDLILLNTSKEDQIGLREDNLKFVGTWKNDERKIQYFPIVSDDVDKALDIFLEYYNDNINYIDNEYDAIIRPIIYHGLLSALQLFKDGNTRYARTIQHVELWGLLNNLISREVPLPLVYATRIYSNPEYREHIRDIAINNDNCWDEWIDYNISKIRDSIGQRENYTKGLQRKFP